MYVEFNEFYTKLVDEKKKREENIDINLMDNNIQHHNKKKQESPKKDDGPSWSKTAKTACQYGLTPKL